MTDDGADYPALMRQAWEDEVATETCYRSLAAHHSGRARVALELLARVERATADLLAPVLARLDLEPAAEAELPRRGRAEAADDAGLTWPEFLAHVVEAYPAYVAEFEAIEAIAPPEDRRVTRDLTAHEVAVLDFARLERAGDDASLAPLEEFLAARGGAGSDS